jgi:hypothetical protein
LKVCAVGLRGIPEIMGGIETHCEQLYTELCNEVKDIVILARSPYVKSEFKFRENVRVIPIFTTKNKILETFLHTFIYQTRHPSHSCNWSSSIYSASKIAGAKSYRYSSWKRL